MLIEEKNTMQKISNIMVDQDDCSFACSMMKNKICGKFNPQLFSNFYYADCPCRICLLKVVCIIECSKRKELIKILINNEYEVKKKS